MKNQNYNGWSNKETWAVFVNLGNSGMANEITDVGERLAGSFSPDERNRATAQFAEYLSDLLDELRELRSENPEIMRVFDEIGSLWRVDFYELAEAWMP